MTSNTSRPYTHLFWCKGSSSTLSRWCRRSWESCIAPTLAYGCTSRSTFGVVKHENATKCPFRMANITLVCGGQLQEGVMTEPVLNCMHAQSFTQLAWVEVCNSSTRILLQEPLYQCHQTHCSNYNIFSLGLLSMPDHKHYNILFPDT